VRAASRGERIVFRRLIAWLGIDARKTVALHPSRTVELDLPADAAFDRCRHGVEDVLGGVVREAYRDRGTLEATFGLIYSDRLTCTVVPIDAAHARVIIETRRGAQAGLTAPSPYVKALADFLTN